MIPKGSIDDVFILLDGTLRRPVNQYTYIKDNIANHLILKRDLPIGLCFKQENKYKVQKLFEDFLRISKKCIILDYYRMIYDEKYFEVFGKIFNYYVHHDTKNSKNTVIFSSYIYSYLGDLGNIYLWDLKYYPKNEKKQLEHFEKLFKILYGEN